MTTKKQEDILAKLKELRLRLIAELSAREKIGRISAIPPQLLLAEAEADGVDFSAAIRRSLESKNWEENGGRESARAEQFTATVLQFKERRDTTPIRSVIEERFVDATGEWLSLPLAIFDAIDLTYGRAVLAVDEPGVASQKIGKSIPLAILNSVEPKLVNIAWQSAEVRLILSIDQNHEVHDVSVTTSGLDPDKLTDETLDLRLRDRRGNERMFSLSREQLQGYMEGSLLSSDIAGLELLVHVGRPAA